MTTTTKPTKQRVREYMDRRTHAEHDDPPPTPQEVRDQLGWNLIPENGSEPEVQD